MHAAHDDNRRARAAEPIRRDRAPLDRPPELTEAKRLDRRQHRGIRRHWITFGAPDTFQAMGIKLRDLKTEARNLAQAGQLGPALAAHEHMLAQNPLDHGSRRKIADLLLQLGDKAGASQVYRAVAMHDIRSGHPLPAIVACKVLASLGEKVDDLVGALAATYAHGSKALAKFTSRPAPVDLDAEIAPVDPAAGVDIAAAAGRARARALDLSAFAQYPAQCLPVPFFS